MKQPKKQIKPEKIPSTERVLALVGSHAPTTDYITAEQKGVIYQMVLSAVRRGRLVKRDTCEHCPSSKRIVAHHFDYDYPLKVIWLCNRCHLRLHGRKLMTRQMQNNCSPDIFEDNINRIESEESEQKDCVDIVNRDCFIRGKLHTYC